MISIWSPWEFFLQHFIWISFKHLMMFCMVSMLVMWFFFFGHLCELLHFELQFVCLQCTPHSSIVNITCKLFVNCFHFKLLDLPLLSTIVVTKFQTHCCEWECFLSCHHPMPLLQLRKRQDLVLAPNKFHWALFHIYGTIV